MMDIIPGAGKLQAPKLPSGNTSGQPGTNAADPSVSGLAATASAASTDRNRPASFADTLQSRLKLMALNKSTPLAHSALPVVGKAPLTDKDTSTANSAVQLASTDTEALPVAKNGAADTTSSDRTPEDDDSGNTAAAPLPPVAPLALNTIAVLPASMPVQHPSVPLPDTNATNQVVQNKSAQADGTNTPANSAVEPEKSAILAATSEKTGLAAANQDSKTTEAQTFQDAMNNRLAMTNTNPPPRTQAASNLPAVAREVQSPLASSHWATDVGNQLSWMAGNNQGHADLVLNPPQLGRIEVSITMNGDQATANFVSANPEVRDALQGSLPRLREVLADAGVFLGQANIGAESFSQNQNRGEKGGKSPDDSFSSSGQSLLGSTNRPLSIGPAQTTQGRGLIDLFA